MHVFTPALVVGGIAAGVGAAKLEQSKPDLPGWVLPTSALGGGATLLTAGVITGAIHAENHWSGGGPAGAKAGILAGVGLGVAVGGLVGAYLGARRD